MGDNEPIQDVTAVSAPDTVPSVPVPHQLHLCHETDAPSSGAELARYSSSILEWQAGMPADDRPVSPAGNSGVLTIVTICFVLLALNYRNCVRILGNFTELLIKPRPRTNAFDDNTANESRTEMLMLFQTCVLEAILLYLCIGVHAPASGVFVHFALLTVITVCYYLFQVMAYLTVGYVFAPYGYTRPLLRTFNGTQSMLGLALMIPTLSMLFYPALSSAMVGVALTLYVLARLVFIRAGFRIFYHNFSSLLYFFLYLCTLEIIPLIAVYRLAVLSCSIL